MNILDQITYRGFRIPSLYPWPGVACKRAAKSAPLLPFATKDCDDQSVGALQRD